MKVVPNVVLDEHKRAQDLVWIGRELIDDVGSHGFILDFNEEWVMLMTENDFLLDGVKLLRRKDTTSLKCGETQAFQKKLMQVEGQMEEIDFSSKLPGKGLRELLDDLPADKVVILENQLDDLFLIGFYKGIDDDNEVVIRFFDGKGKLDKEMRYIALD